MPLGTAEWFRKVVRRGRGLRVWTGELADQVLHRDEIPGERRSALHGQNGSNVSGDTADGINQEMAAAWLAAEEAGCLDVPADVHDPSSWDRYWTEHIKVGMLDQGFADMMSSDPTLPPLLERRGARTILCAGNGLSTEALSLALLGFSVTALDISSVPRAAFERMLRDAEHPLRQIPGFGLEDDGTVKIDVSAVIEPSVCPPIHRSDRDLPRGGGSLRYVTGDIMDTAICPGPFDVVIERRTLQLFPVAEQQLAFDRLAARLGETGLFISHAHKGVWQPGQPLEHFADKWISSRGFTRLDANHELSTRAAFLVLTSG